MKTVIAGGRDERLTHEDIAKLDELVKTLPIITVITGGASGIDTDAHNWARSRMIPAKIEHAKWGVYGRRAGPIRNELMASQCEAVVLFKGGSGTADMHRRAVAYTRKIIDLRPEAE
jgi:hypothetical protein